MVNRSAAAQSVELPIGPPAANASMVDWLDPAEAVLDAASTAPDARPRIHAVSAVKPAVVSHNGKATVFLKPWGTMILAPAGAN
jgi:hypothetical protein